MLNKSKGNMYPFVTHTWNAIKGKCEHDCVYCYMKQFKQNDLRLDEKEFKTDLGRDNFIFVGSSTDMFADGVKVKWIGRTIKHCCAFPDNKYLFQSKNPLRMVVWRDKFPPNTILGTTIETNNNSLGLQYSKAPKVSERGFWLSVLSNANFKTMVTIEPILDFDVANLVLLIEKCKPAWVNIGADSKRHGLPEPSSEKVKELIAELEQFTEVKVKKNLKRLMK